MDILIEILEVYINQILYTRGLYPAQIFKKRCYLNTPVFISIYPPLNSYLRNILKSARELAQNKEQNELQCLELLLYNAKTLNTMEKYAFDLKQFNADDKHIQNDEYLLDFEQSLRSSLYALEKRLNALPKLSKMDDIRFKILLHTTQSGFMRLNHNPHYQVVI